MLVLEPLMVIGVSIDEHVGRREEDSLGVVLVFVVFIGSVGTGNNEWEFLVVLVLLGLFSSAVEL